MHRLVPTVFLALVLWCVPGFAQKSSITAEESGIRAVLDKQAMDWNRGDLDAFATGYKDSADILFMGSKINRGYAQMLERYRSVFSTREKMGTLTFSDIEVQWLDERFATATGKFHLERTAAGGGESSGSYMLVFEKTPKGWKIVRDVTISSEKQ
ncbi:MAG TPA: nuclear transport factor 2 family protein [Edaphobacter sp.]